MGKGSFKNYSFDKVLRDKVFNIANNTKLDGYQRGLSPIVYRFFDKKLPCVMCLVYQLAYVMFYQGQQILMELLWQN